MFCFVIAFPFGQRPKGSDTTFCQDDKTLHKTRDTRLLLLIGSLIKRKESSRLLSREFVHSL